MKKISAFLLVFIFTLLLYVPQSQLTSNQSVHAQGVDAVIVVGETAPTNITRTIKSTVNAASNAITAESSFTLLGKEIFLDQIAFNIAQMTLKQITQSIVNWINSGFEGNPAFLTNLDDMLLEAADREFGSFLEGSDLDFVCSPFQLDIKIALSTQYAKSDNFASQVQCSFTEAVGNVENFVGGTFADGGWGGWFELTQNPENTPVGAFMKSKLEIEARIADEQGKALTELGWGDGTFSKTLCELVEGEGATIEKCNINMPGKYIQEQLTFQLSSGSRSLIEADEINEIIGALFAQLAQQAITGINGMLGLSESGGGGGGSYLDQMLEEQTQTNESALTIFNQALADEEEYRELYTDVADTINDVDARNEANIQRYEGCYALSLPRQLTNYRSDAVVAELSAENSIAIVEQMVAELSSPGISTDRQQDIYTLFQTMLTDGTLHTKIDIAEGEVDLWDFDKDVTAFETRMSNRADECREEENSGGNGGPDGP
ncbi:hypothetical protein N9L26_01965 [Candidatus Pacebacteria bacterium]|nr:hypothetical protein [Candidatus Paceibacterota bacterium]